MFISKNNKIKILLILTIILSVSIIELEKHLKLDYLPLENISLNKINQVILTQGTLQSQRIIKNHSFLTFKDKNKDLKTTFFNFNKSLEKNKNYEIIGKIVPYQNKAQLNILELKVN